MMRLHGEFLAALIVFATISCWLCDGQPQHFGAAGDKWVWGSRQQTANPSFSRNAKVLSSSIIPPPQHQPLPVITAQRRHGRFIDNSRKQPTTFGSSPFKSITATSFPSSAPRPFNDLHVQKQQQKQTKSRQKTTIKPSPIDTTFTSHFDVFSGKVSTSKSNNPNPPITKPATKSSQPTLITRGEYPYPFDAKPFDLGDGTSIGYAPHDTLPVHEENKKSNKVQPTSTTEEQDPRYTTLDRLFNSRGPTKLPDPNNLSNADLGGLHPNEVFYATDDLIIIKGGGFHSPKPYVEDLDDIEQGAQGNVKPSHLGNELGESNDITITNVRPDELFNKVPLPLRFINGNIPVVVKPSSPFTVQQQSNRQHRKAPQVQTFRPVYHTPFIPVATTKSLRHDYSPSSSQQVQHISTAPNTRAQNYQHLDEVMVAEPSEAKIHVVAAPTKRSADSSVVSYHYQTRGSGNNVHSIVDYKVHKENPSTVQQRRTDQRIQNQNNIQFSQKETGHNQKQRQQRPGQQQQHPGQQQQHHPGQQQQHPGQQQQHHHPGQQHQGQQSPQFNTNREDFTELEDLSAPQGVKLVPLVQTPKKRPNPRPTFTQSQRPHQQNQHFVPSVQQSRPPQQQTPLHQQHFVPSVQQTRPVQHSVPNNNVRPPQHQQPVISLAGDTRVNFLHPLPPVNPQATFIAQRPKVGGNHNQGRAPVRTRGGNPARRQANNASNNRRFMEPRLRTSNRRSQQRNPTH